MCELKLDVTNSNVEVDKMYGNVKCFLQMPLLLSGLGDDETSHQWLTHPNFNFEPTLYVSQGDEQASGFYTGEERLLFKQIRVALPELNAWGDLPLGVALGDYFQQVYLVSWLELLTSELTRESLLEFLIFLYDQQTLGDPQG